MTDLSHIRRKIDKLLRHSRDTAKGFTLEGRMKEQAAYLKAAQNLAQKYGLPVPVDAFGGAATEQAKQAETHVRSGPPNEKMAPAEALVVVFTFGKHIGKTVRWVLTHQPGYLKWMLDLIDGRGVPGNRDSIPWLEQCAVRALRIDILYFAQLSDCRIDKTVNSATAEAAYKVKTWSVKVSWGNGGTSNFSSTFRYPKPIDRT